MIRPVIKVVFAIIILFAPQGSFGDEAVKLRHVATIYVDSKGNGMNRPEGITCNQKSLVVVADTGNSRLLRYTFKDGVVNGGGEIKAPEIAYPLRVQMNSAGEIFVLDGASRRIVRLNPDGTFKSYIEPEGLPASSPTVVPKSFRIASNDNIYILDIFSDRMLVLDPAGTYLKQIELPKDSGFISDIAVGAGGKIFLLDSVKAMVYSASQEGKEFSPMTGSLKEDMNFPANLAIDSSGVIYIADLTGSAVTVLGPDGSFRGHQLAFGWKEGLTRYPSQLCIDEKDELFLADRDNSRVQIFNLIR